MMKKVTIGFLFSTALLVGSEYVFLHEVFLQKRVLVLVFSLSGIALASYFFFLFFLRYHKAVKDL